MSDNSFLYRIIDMESSILIVTVLKFENYLVVDKIRNLLSLMITNILLLEEDFTTLYPIRKFPA